MQTSFPSSGETLLPPSSAAPPLPGLQGAGLRLVTLGSLALTTGCGERAEVGTQPRRLVLLAVIAAHGYRGIAREKAVALFWPDADEVKGRNSLSQALYALRRDLGREDLLLESADLRLNPDAIACDACEFQAAVAARRYDRAVELYTGPFLDGFYLREAPELNRWLDERRSEFQGTYTTALERLARAAQGAGDHAEAIRLWRLLAVQEPVSARWALGLMLALRDAGDRAGALRHARVHAELVRQEFAAEVDDSIKRLEQELRAASTMTAAGPAIAPRPPVLEPTQATTGSPHGPAPHFAPPDRPGSEATIPRRSRVLRLVAGLAALCVSGVLAARSFVNSGASRGVVAVGDFRDFASRAPDGGGRAPLLSGLVVTGLGQVPGLRLVSAERMAELASAHGAGTLAAARASGATEVVDGSLFQVAPDDLRLDLRRVDLATGQVLEATTVTGATVPALADSAVARLRSSYRLPGTVEPLGVVAPFSLAAARLYEAGVRAFFAGDSTTALGLFGAALDEDSTFAMAAYFASRSSGQLDYLERAYALAPHANERDRLLIELEYARMTDTPGILAIADSLTRRYPTEPDGFLGMGYGLTIEAGDFLGAVAEYRKALALDPDGLGVRGVRCVSCEAEEGIVTDYLAADSLGLAEREARRWLAQARMKGAPAAILAMILSMEGRPTESIAADSAAHALDPVNSATLNAPLRWVSAGEYDRASALAAAQVRSALGAERANGLWAQYLIARDQGRPRAALRLLGEWSAVMRGRLAPGAPIDSAWFYFPTLLEAGRPLAAAQVISGMRRLDSLPSVAWTSRAFVWSRTIRATALYASGDTGALGPLADSVRVRGGLSGFGRDHRLYHQILGLQALARHRPDLAASQFRAAAFSYSTGYTRINFELARSLLELNRAPEAIPVLRAGLHGVYDGPALQVTRTELRALLGRAYLQVGQTDSAKAYLRQAILAWKDAEAPYVPRRDSLEALLAGVRP